MKRREGARPASAEPNDGCAVRPAGSAAPPEAAGGLGADEPGYAEGGAGPARPAAAESGGAGGIGGAGASAGHGTGAAGAAPASTARPPRTCVSAGSPSEGGVLRDPVAASATPRADAACEALRATVAARGLVAPDAAALLMVSGGSDSTALAYLAHRLRGEGTLGAVAMLHVNHQLRGADADADALFVAALAACLGIPLFSCEVDVAGEAARTGGNVEAVARRERYQAANEALRSLCRHEGLPLAEARILTAHTADDRIESFYMRSIVGTGPGGFRSMRYRNGPVVRPLLDLTRAELCAVVEERAAAGLPVVRDGAGGLWREDATNAHTDRFRAYVRHEVVPRARQWNAALPDVLTRTMNLIADEDDLMEELAAEVVTAHAGPLAPHAGCEVGGAPGAGAVRGSGAGAGAAAGEPAGVAGIGRASTGFVGFADVAGCAGRRADGGAPGAGAAGRADAVGAGRAGAGVAGCADQGAPAAPWAEADFAAGFLLTPSFGGVRRPLQRRAVRWLLQAVLGADARVETGAIEAVLAGFAPAEPLEAAPIRPRGGYVANIQGDLAVSANRRGVRVEPMAAFRSRRKRG